MGAGMEQSGVEATALDDQFSFAKFLKRLQPCLEWPSEERAQVLNIRGEAITPNQVVQAAYSAFISIQALEHCIPKGCTCATAHRGIPTRIIKYRNTALIWLSHTALALLLHYRRL